ncbi:hypothetical protein RHMOL_Rhmol04G0349200 [Rhododendron molle]|nr:hypothetical protein RHMOL_Rhmol04G0349200 [Rhododendron molle]
MSCFLVILRCIIGVDDDQEEETRLRNSNRYNSPYYDTPSRGYVPPTTTTTTTTNATTYGQIREPSGAYRTTPSGAYGTTPSGAYRTTSSGAYTTTPTPTRSNSNSWNSTPTKLPEKPNISFVKPKATIHSSVVNRPEASIRTPDKSHEAAAQKPKILPPSPFPTDYSKKKAINLATDQTSAQKSPYGLSSFSPQPSPSLTKSLASSAKTLPSVSSQPSPSLTKSLASSAKTLPFVSMPPPRPVSSLSSSSFGTPPSSPKPCRPSTKPFLSLAPSNSTNPNSKTAYILVEKDASPIYAIPEDFKDLIKNDVVPRILKRPLSPSTYKDYFEALLYAEDFYLEKWDGFEMKNVPLKLEEASIHKRKGKYNKKNVDDEKDDKVFVAFELDSIPERRPFLLSRDFVSVSPSGTRAEPFQGLIYRVVQSCNRVLVDFGDDFHVQHYSACKYNVKFSFNRVCLKRAHQAIATASDNLFRNFLFPDSISKNSLLTAQLPSIDSNLDWRQISAVRHILSNQNAVPYLVEGPVTVNRSIFSSRTGFVVCEAVLQVYRTSPSCRILICAPTNKGCDAITIRLRGKIPESNIFRANAAFRELDGVPEEILPSCLYIEERECFSCPSTHELEKFKVISSTFMSSHRLHNEGITAGHFSHIFLVDASSVIEPEAMVALANLANESTVVTVTGAPGDHSGWIHSRMARQNGLLISYFERLRKSKLYDSLDSKVITVLGRNSNDT